MDEEPALHALPRRFWAEALKGAIARNHAVRTWSHIGSGDRGYTFDDVLLGFSAFMDISPQDITTKLDALGTQCRQRLIGQGRVLDPDMPEYDLSTLVVAIREFMNNEGFGVASGLSFPNPFHQFPAYLLGPGRSATLPMSMNWVFAAICRRLGIRAGPTNTPGKVLCHLTSPDPQKSDMLFDVCGTDPPITFSSKDPAVMLSEAGMPPSFRSDAVLPGSLPLMVRRAAYNIFHVTRRAPFEHGRPGEQIRRADYAASAAVAAVSEPWEAQVLLGRLFRPSLPEIPPSCPLDMEPVFLDVLTGYSSQQRDEAAGRYSIYNPPGQNSHRPKHRPYTAFSPFVGQPSPTGCTIGWEVVERADGSPLCVHYVLTQQGMIPTHMYDDNPLPPMPLTPQAARRFREDLSLFDQYVEDVVIPREDGIGGRFVPSLELQAAYPDDMEYGERWTNMQLEVLT
ncbi:hypothetical protein C8Q79DRAFT_898083 [Trametes meyenii]|nr:hypothetical protein C8Q79DRAFT_898083 [Trametes meyenii]